MSKKNYGMPPEQKKGEIAELKALLRDPAIDKDQEKKRDVIKKVIAFMTMGIDMSRLFSDMILATNTRDMFQKKLIYLYLTYYAQDNQELALLAINTLQKDCKDESPLVRGLALRSVTSLRLATVAEYVVPLLKNGLIDPSPYVRRVACIGCAKLYKTAPKNVKEGDLLDRLYLCLRDTDADVIASAIVGMQEIQGDAFRVDGGLVLYLLNRIRDFNEWHQCLILQLVLKHAPSANEEIFDIMNLLEDRLKHNNSAVILATSKVFLHLTQNMPPVHQQVYMRIKEPLLTVMSTSSTETAYACLAHIKLLVSREPRVFAPSFKDFFCRYNDPAPVKALKLEILTEIAADDNVHSILTEITEYVSDIDQETAKRAIRAIGSIAVKLTSSAAAAINALLGFLDMDADHVRSETFVVFKDLLRKYQDQALCASFLPSFSKRVFGIEDVDAKCSVIWILGEYGQMIEDAPYNLEDYVDRYAEESPAVKLQLLTSLTKLFFKRAPECQPILGRLMDLSLSDFDNTDVRDRALLIYRLLSTDPTAATQVVNCPKSVIYSFSEDVPAEVKDRLFEEFNSLSVLYGKVSESFIVKDDKTYTEEPKTTVTNTGAQDEEEDASASLLTDEHPISVATAAGAAPSVDNLLDFSDPTTLRLAAAPTIDPPTFQQKWGTLPQIGAIDARVRPGLQAATVESALMSRSIACLASGSVGTFNKFYFYAQKEGTMQHLLVEAIVSFDGAVQAKFKADSADIVPPFVDLFRSALSLLA